MASSSATTQHALQAQFDQARARTDDLFALLQPGAIYERPVNERHRLIFYLGHVEAFDWNIVCRGALGRRTFNPHFDKLFELGIDPEPGQAPQDQASDWPSVAEVTRYTAEVRRQMDESLAEAPDHLLHVALEHRLMHAETLAYLLHNFPYQYKIFALHANESGAVPVNPLIRIPAGTATLGQEPGGFGWDNEFDEHRVQVPAFAISKYKVTNGEYRRFVEETGAAAPHFWLREQGQWLYRGMFEQIPLPLNWPVYVAQAEATRYAEWAGKQLPTEAQFHRAAYGTPGGEERAYPWGSIDPSDRFGNFDFHRWDPEPVTAHPAGDSAFGVSQLVGNGWEWTSTPFGPFEGFRIFDHYPGYSKNFFDNAHFVMKGASPRTAASFLRRSFRNWFRAEYPYVYAGFRLVES